MFLATIISILLLAAGCMPTQQKAPCEPPYKQIGDKCCMDLNNNNICDSEEEPFEQAEKEKVSGQTMMKQFLSTLDTINGYSYKYKQDTYKVNQDSVKRELVRQVKIPVEEPVGPKKTTMPWIDVIYFNTAEEKATGFCEGLDDTGERMCSGYELWDIPIAVDYEKRYRKTPTDWLEAFSDKEPSEIKEKYRYEDPGVEVTGLVFVEEGKTTMLDIDPTTGIVVKATVDEEGYVTEYAYENIQTGIGTVQHEYKEEPEKPKLSETGPQAVSDTEETTE